MTEREQFEAHMLSLNACTRLARQKESLGGHYRTTTVNRAWDLWQASRKQALEEAASLCLADDGRDVGMTGRNCADAIRDLATKARTLKKESQL